MKILLLNDMDNFSCDWRGYVLNRHFPGKPIEWLNRHENREGLLNEMYKKDPELFLNLPVLNGFHEYWEKIRNEFGNEIEIGWLTAHGGHHASHEEVFMHKHEWLRINIPEAHRDEVFAMVSASKDKPEAMLEFLEDYDHVILVDDFKRTIDDVKGLDHANIHGVWFNYNWMVTINEIRQVITRLLP